MARIDDDERIAEKVAADGGHVAIESDPSKHETRRHLLKVGAVAAGAALTGALMSRQSASAQTGITAASSDTAPAILGTNSDGGAGVEGDNTGSNLTGGPGVKGVSNSAGLQGIGVNGGTGVAAQSDIGNGVFATSGSGIGVLGTASVSQFGIGGTTAGVVGASTSATGIGVLAINGAGAALQVSGKAKFSTAGSSTIAAGATSATVSDTNVTASSHLTVALTNHPGNAAVVQWVERLPSIGFVLHMSKHVRHATGFTYLTIEP